MTNAMLYQMMEGQQINQYHLESLLGAGGFGGVFSASEVVRDQVLRQLAIKIIPSNDNQQLKELIAAANLEHDHLIRSYSAGECKILKFEMLYLAMELAEGSLENRFNQGEFKVAETRQIVKEILLGLDYLHSQKHVHRDLKPGNILRAKNRWKLSDFGLIRRLDNQSYAKTSNPIGTIAYMPPEAFDGKISFAWDMWSVGIMLVQMSTQRLPYQFSEPTQLLKRVMNCDLQLPPLPEEFKPIILGCLQSDRAKRWTAEQALSALERSSGSSPTVVIKGNFYDKQSSLGGNFIEPEMIILPAGEYWMGSPDSDGDAYGSEKPRHLVKIASFAIGKYPITQEQYEAVMGENPSHFQNKPKNPVECVTQQKAREFCQKLSERTGKKYRLPSEAEWEYACRAGSETRYYFGDDASKLGEYAWYMDNSNSQTHPVGQKKPNKWGLYDMHGNVWEWCEDEWHSNYQGMNDNPSQNSRYVLRGGYWNDPPRDCRSAYRSYRDYDDLMVGFRPAFSVQDSSPLHS